MTPTPRRAPACLALLLAFALAGAAAPRADAEELYIFTASAFGALGGSVDADPGESLGNAGFQLGFSYVTEPRTRVAVRAGQIGLGDGDEFNLLTDADLTYATVSGEYLFSEPYYDSWVYLGLGAYQLDGTPRFAGVDDGETAIGAVVGVTGEFYLTRSLDFVVELSGHYADFDDSQVFALGHAGIAFHF